MPNINELVSLVDYAQSGPALPSGHPFGTSVQSSELYWSSSSLVSSPANVWIVKMFNGNNSFGLKLFSHFLWPVRGGQ